LTNPNNPAKCSLYTNSDTNGAAYQACQRALNALDLGALAGPNSAACKKKQLADVLSAPCKVVTNQFAVTIGGKDTTILEPTLIGPCYHRPQRMVGDPKFIPASGMGPADQPFHPPSLIPGTGIRPRFVLPLPVSWGQPGNGTGTGGNDGSGVVTHRPNPNQPGFNGWGGGGGGGPTAHIDPGGKPHSILQPPTGGGHGPAITNPIRPLPRGPASADLPRPRLIPGGQSGTGAGGGTGGGTNSAMDTLGTKNTDEAMHGAAGGGSGGLGDTRPLPGAHGPSVTPPPWGGRPAPLGVPKQQAKGGPTGGGTNGTQRQGDDTTMKGGGGTTNPKQPTTGGGTNGTYSQAPIKPPPGGATGNANAHPITKLKITPSTPKPPADVQIDYGGCGGCGKGDGFVAPK
jgi:hypothetical protein